MTYKHERFSLSAVNVRKLFSMLVSNSDQCELLLLNQEFACECKILNFDESIIYSIIVQQ